MLRGCLVPWRALSWKAAHFSKKLKAEVERSETTWITRTTYMRVYEDRFMVL